MIVVRLKGGLGNQMFQYALGRVLSIKNNTELVFNIEAYQDKSPRMFKSNFAMRDLQLDVFTIAGRVAKKSEIPFLYRMYGKGKLMVLIDAVRRRIFRHKAQEIYFEKFNPALLTLGPNAYLDGFFQSPKYFAGYEEAIKKDFSLKESLPLHIAALVEEIKKTESVCIHVRRTDFIGNAAHEVTGKDYHTAGLAYIREHTAVTNVYVFSDDIAWCKENLSFPLPTVFVDERFNGPKDVGNFMLMSACRHFVIANSSFAWWAVWMSDSKDKIVVAPKQWFGDPLIDTSDLIPKNWVRM